MTHYVLLLHCHISISPYTHTQPISLPPFLSLPPPLFSKALPSFSIPQVHHTESHCVRGLGREHTVQPLTMCCLWTHLRRPQTTVQPFHTHTLPLSVSISSLVPSLSSISCSTIRSLFSSAHTSTAFWKSATINRLHPPFFNPCL